MHLPRMKALPLLISSLIAAPVSAVITVLLSPFWRWFEPHAGIESIGHSGPAGWCYIGVYIVLVSALITGYFVRVKRAGSAKKGTR